MLETIEDAEVKLSKILQETGRSWQTAASVIIEVEEQELWRRGNHYSFTAWLEKLAKGCGVSMSWVWQAYRAGKVLFKIHQRKHPDSDQTFPELAEIYKDVSATSLELSEKISEANAPDILVRKIQDQVVENNANLGWLRNLYNEYDQGRRTGRKNNDLIASIHQLNFSNIIHGAHRGFLHLEKGKPIRQTIYSRFPADSYLDILVVVPTAEGNPSFIGNLTRNKLRHFNPAVLDYCDYVFYARHVLDKDDYELPEGLTGTIIIDPLKASYRLEVNQDKNQISDARKGALSMYLLNRSMLGKDILINPLFDRQ